MAEAPIFEETTSRFLIVSQHTVVHEDGITLTVSPLPFGEEFVPAEDIEEATVTEYAPATYGGWHWGVHRTQGGNTVYRLRGSDGVELRRRDGTRVFVGSDAPAELEAAVETVAIE